MAENCRIIGIGGISRSGKSFLARELESKLMQSGKRVEVLDQDDFVFPAHQIPLICDHIDWEVPESIDFHKFNKAILDAVNKNDYVIAEGLMVFLNPDIFRMFDFTVFIDLQREEFISRKKTDLRWGKEPEWYIDHIWEGFLKYGRFPNGQIPDLILNGKGLFKIEEIYQKILI